MRTTRLLVTMRDVVPRVERVIDVPAAITLDELHEVVQVAIGWTDLPPAPVPHRGRRLHRPLRGRVRGLGSAPCRSSAPAGIRSGGCLDRRGPAPPGRPARPVASRPAGPPQPRGAASDQGRGKRARDGTSTSIVVRAQPVLHLGRRTSRRSRRGPLPVAEIAADVHPLLGHGWSRGGKPITTGTWKTSSTSSRTAPGPRPDHPHRSASSTGPSARSLLPRADLLADLLERLRPDIPRDSCHDRHRARLDRLTLAPGKLGGQPCHPRLPVERPAVAGTARQPASRSRRSTRASTSLRSRMRITSSATPQPWRIATSTFRPHSPQEAPRRPESPAMARCPAHHRRTGRPAHHRTEHGAHG